MKSREEIEFFDRLEKKEISNSGDSTQETNMLNSIRALDEIMTQQPMEELSTGFASRLMTDLSKLKSRKSRFKLFAWTFAVFGALIGLSWLYALGQQDIATPTYLNSVMNQFSGMMSMIADPRFKQIFLISEGIICLVIIEKIVSSYRFFKFPTS